MSDFFMGAASHRTPAPRERNGVRVNGKLGRGNLFRERERGGNVLFGSRLIARKRRNSSSYFLSFSLSLILFLFLSDSSVSDLCLVQRGERRGSFRLTEDLVVISLKNPPNKQTIADLQLRMVLCAKKLFRFMNSVVVV